MPHSHCLTEWNVPSQSRATSVGLWNPVRQPEPGVHSGDEEMETSVHPRSHLAAPSFPAFEFLLGKHTRPQLQGLGLERA